MRDLKYDIARSFAMIWIVGIYHMSEYVSLPLHTQQWARIVTWSCLGVFTFISAYFLSGKNTFFNFSDIFLFYKKRLLRFYPLFFVAAITMLLIDFNDWDQTWRGLLGVSSYYAPQINTLWYISMLIGFYLITPPLVLCGKLQYKLLLYTIIILGICICKFIFRTGVDNRVFYYFNKSVDKYINLTNRLLRRFYRGFSNDLENVRNSLLCVIILSNNPCQKQR